MPRMSAPDRKGTGQPRDPLQVPQIAGHSFPRSRVHQFHGDGPAVVPHGPMYLAEGCGSGVPVVEVAEQPPPAFAQLFSQHCVNRLRQHCRCRFLQLRQGNSIRCGDLIRQDEFVDRHELPEFRRARPQFAEHLEHVACRAGHAVRHSLRLEVDRSSSCPSLRLGGRRNRAGYSPALRIAPPAAREHRRRVRTATPSQIRRRRARLSSCSSQAYGPMRPLPLNCLRHILGTKGASWNTTR